ncbi:hypothetical protein [Vagococcus sp. WN89Y]|uniref:hypothetical protein n=1 Tax=Vagococcus sp. WN89Y TaxID=3457258 RepID=UPI003FCD9EA6
MPSVTSGSTVFTPLNYPHQQNDSVYYLSHWQAWERNTPAGSGEFRRIAVERLQACLEYKNATLDLADLELSCIPAVLPSHITTLNLTNNQITHLPGAFPPSLKNVFLDNNPLSCETRQRLKALPGAESVIHFAESQSEKTALIPSDYPALQAVLKQGREIRLEVKEALASRHWLANMITPRTSLLAGGIIAGIALVSGAAIYLGRQGANYAAAKENMPVAARGLDNQSSGELVVAEPVMADLSVPVNNTGKINISPDNSTEGDLLDFFRRENLNLDCQPTKEALVSCVARWLFPLVASANVKNNTLKLVKYILNNTDFYSGKIEEPLSPQVAKSVIRQWVISTLLDKPLHEYIAEKMIADTTGRYQTLASLYHLISMPALFFDGKLDVNNIPAGQWNSFESMWNTIINAEIPLLDEKFKGVQQKRFTEYEFLALYTGAEFLAQQGALDNFTLSDIAETGASIWGTMIRGREAMVMLPYLITPALWFVACSAPDLLKGPRASWPETVVPVVLRQWQDAQELANNIQRYLSDYQNAFDVWANKGALADKFVARCPLDKIMYMQNWGDDNLPQWQINKNIREQAKERYLLYNDPPCTQDNVPPSLNLEYQQVTDNVANAFRKLDRLLVEGALSSVNKDDYNFICSPTSKTHPAFLKMRTEVQAELSAPTMFGGAPYVFILIELKNTELFAVINNNEERIYGLKKNDGDHNGYTLYRLDRDVRLYINHDMLTYEHFWTNYQLIDEKVKTRGHLFSFNINVPQTQLYENRDTGSDAFINYFSTQHRETFHKTLYRMGDVRSATENFWSALKPIIPFYGCIEGLASDVPMEKVEAGLSCFLDVISLLPVIGQATAIGGKFGLSVAMGMRSGVLKAGQGATAKAIASAVAAGIALPAAGEMRALLLSALRALDPGMEPLLRGGARIAHISAGVSNPQLADKLEQIAARPPVAAKNYRKAKLPVSGQEVSIKKVRKNQWVQVNPQTGEEVGKYYRLEKGELKVIERDTHMAKHRHAADASVAVHPPALQPAPAGYRLLPPVPGRSSYWNTVRGITDNFPGMIIDPSPNNNIQRLNRFLPEPPLRSESVEKANEIIKADLENFYAPYPWRAWAGVNPYSPESVPPWLAPMQDALRSQAQQSLSTFQRVWIRLWGIEYHGAIMESNVGHYLSGILNTDQPEVIQEAFSRLSNIVKRGYNYLTAVKEVDYNNLIIASSDLQLDSANPGRYISTLPDTQLYTVVPFAAVLRTDPESRIVFFADKYHNNLLLPTSITDNLNHEVSHASSNTGDMFTHTLPESGEISNGMDVRRMFYDNFAIRKSRHHFAIIYDRPDFINFINNLKMHQGITKDLTESEIFAAVVYDPMFRANIMMSDAQVVATIIRDIAADRPFDAVIRARRDAGEHNNSSSVNDALRHAWISLTVGEALRVGKYDRRQP